MTLNNDFITVNKSVLEKMIKTINDEVDCNYCLLFDDCYLTSETTCEECLYNLLKGVRIKCQD